LIRGDEHAAFACGEQFPRVEGEGGQVRSRADGPAAVYGAYCAGGVLDHGDSARLAKRPHRVEIGEDRDGCDVTRGIRGGYERQRWDDDLVARLDPGCYESKVQGRGTRGDRDPVADADC